VNVSLAKDLAIILAGVVALTTFFFGVLEYARQGHQARAQNFVEMRRRFLENELFRQILNLLATDDGRLREVPIQDRRNFVGFLEEVALMVNSKLISREVAHYMFGYYVLLTDRSEHFWEGLDRPSVYWSVFRRFASSMGEVGEPKAELGF
jgi:hypothetical protein